MMALSIAPPFIAMRSETYLGSLRDAFVAFNIRSGAILTTLITKFYTQFDPPRFLVIRLS